MKNTVKKQWMEMSAQFKKAIPVILFFLFLFYTVILLFGVKYVMIISFMTVLFKVRYLKPFSLRKTIHTVLIQLVLAVLAFIATLHIGFAVVLNILVPFLLVFLKSTQFNQKGYFASMMCFVFLQLRPVGWDGFFPLMEVIVYALSVYVIALLIAAAFHRQEEDYILVKKGLSLFSSLIEEAIEGKSQKETVAQLFAVQQALYKKAYQSGGFSKVVSGEGKVQYMFALLLQRAIYFFTNRFQPTMMDAAAKAALQEFARYLQKAQAFQEEPKQVREAGKAMLSKLETGAQEDSNIFMQNALRTLLIGLDVKLHAKEKLPQYNWQLPKHQFLKRKMLPKLRLDSFEFRFAFRLSFVVTIAFMISTLTNWNHAYWIVLNAFLLLQPMYEESAYRLKTRFIGTIIGCVCVYFLFHMFTGLPAHFVIATIMVSCLYTATPGTWVQAMFSTCFALTLTTMSMQQTTAIELRLTYVVLAILLVLVVNRFLFPTSMGSQFQYNFQMLFHMQHDYLRMLKEAMDQPLEYGLICDALTNYHMVHDQLQEYLNKQKLEDSYYHEVLSISWRMVSEMEQMLFLLKQQTLSTKEQAVLENYILVSDDILNYIQRMLQQHVKKSALTIEIDYCRTLPKHVELSNIMEQYAKNISKLYYLIYMQSLRNH